MKISDFDFELPKELIAQKAMEPRDSSKLLVLDKKEKTLEHRHFFNIIDYLKKMAETKKVSAKKIINYLLQMSCKYPLCCTSLVTICFHFSVHFLLFFVVHILQNY